MKLNSQKNKYKCKSNQIERWLKSNEVQFSSVTDPNCKDVTVILLGEMLLEILRKWHFAGQSKGHIKLALHQAWGIRSNHKNDLRRDYEDHLNIDTNFNIPVVCDVDLKKKIIILICVIMMLHTSQTTDYICNVS